MFADEGCDLKLVLSFVGDISNRKLSDQGSQGDELLELWHYFVLENLVIAVFTEGNFCTLNEVAMPLKLVASGMTVLTFHLGGWYKNFPLLGYKV